MMPKIEKTVSPITKGNARMGIPQIPMLLCGLIRAETAMIPQMPAEAPTVY